MRQDSSRIVPTKNLKVFVQAGHKYVAKMTSAERRNPTTVVWYLLFRCWCIYTINIYISRAANKDLLNG